MSEQISKERLAELESHSIMLGRIAGYVEDFSRSPEDTTLVCVLRLLCEYYSLKEDAAYEALDRELEET